MSGKELRIKNGEVKYKDPNCYHEAVVFYRETFNLQMNAGWRRDVVATVKTYEDLLLWQATLMRWGYVDKQTGKWKDRNPLDVRGMISVFEFKQREAQRKKDEQRSISKAKDENRLALERKNLSHRSRARVSAGSAGNLPNLLESTRDFT